jgi:GNAT superfamily N-acetyltransferase
MDHTIELSEAGDDAIRSAIVRPLAAYNVEKTGRTDHRPLAVVIRNSDAEVIGGLWGRTAFGWLYVELLVVPESLRGKGIGTELMRRAEAEAARRGCRDAWLDTFEFQARGFYERLGYRCFGELADYPPGFSRYFMTRNL